MNRIGFLIGAVEDGVIGPHLMYVLEEADWFIRVLYLFDLLVDASDRTNIHIDRVRFLTSSLGDPTTSCILFSGQLPNTERVKRWLGCSSSQVPCCQLLEWKKVVDPELVPIQCLRLELAEYEHEVRSGRSRRPRRGTLPNMIAAERVSLTPDGLHYHFTLEEEKKLIQSPVLPWELIRESVAAFKPAETKPKKQTVLVQTQV